MKIKAITEEGKKFYFIFFKDLIDRAIFIWCNMMVQRENCFNLKKITIIYYGNATDSGVYLFIE